MNKYRVSKRIKGVIHPVTLFNMVKQQPYKLPLLPFIVLIKVVTFYWKRLTKRVNIDFKLTPEEEKKNVSELVRILALYLPQFHEIKENNEWWGEGFTEWTNVKAAKPLFKNHYQPHVPHEDVGYYDLSDVNVMKKQAEMAKTYGISGFCFYYYWFKDGKRLLEKPLNNWLQNKDIDFPFCFCWANENWTRTWDGGDSEIIMPQEYTEDNMTGMFEEMLLSFDDSRYIKINGKPLFFVYRAELIPNIKEISAKWRQLAKEKGREIYLVSVQNFQVADPAVFGFDAAMEFAPNNSACSGNSLYISNDIDLDNLCTEEIYNYKATVDNTCHIATPKYKRFRCVFAGWDNSPRRKENKPRIILGQSVAAFKNYLKYMIKYTIANLKGDERIIMVNAWNEWGEGAHLEPDERYGYSYLETVKELTDKKAIDL